MDIFWDTMYVSAHWHQVHHFIASVLYFDAKIGIWLVYDPKDSKSYQTVIIFPKGKVRNCAFDLGNKTMAKDLKIGRDSITASTSTSQKPKSYSLLRDKKEKLKERMSGLASWCCS